MTRQSNSMRTAARCCLIGRLLEVAGQGFDIGSDVDGLDIGHS